MSKKSIISIIVLVILIALGVGAWYFIRVGKTITPSTTTTSTGAPFGVTPGDVTPGSASTPSANYPSTVGSTNTTAPITSLIKISADPVAGAIMFLRNKNEFIRYVDRATGHIFEVDPGTLIKTEIVNNTSPKIYQALWKGDGTTVLERTIRESSDAVINTSLTLSAPKGTSTDNLYSISATELRGSAKSVATNATQVAFVLDSGAVVTSGFNGEKSTTLYSSAFNNWQVAWQGANLTLTSNASADVPGFAYLLKPSGSLTKLLGPLNALTSLISPDGTHIAFSYQDTEHNPLFAIKNITSGSSDYFVPTTLAEKCVWSTKQKTVIYCATPTNGIGQNEPNDWYLGLSHFSDNIWKFNTNDGTATLIVEPKKKFGVDLDIINPQLSPNEDFITFMNKTDLSLWALKL